MKRITALAIYFATTFTVGQVLAQEQNRFEIMKQTVNYATKADSYNAYCNEPSSMASDYLDRFYNDEVLSMSQKNELVGVMEEQVQNFLKWLKEKEPNCNDVAFMMGRLEVMRKLKDVSYIINGVDPASLPPDNIPELEKLLPQATSQNITPPKTQ